MKIKKTNMTKALLLTTLALASASCSKDPSIGGGEGNDGNAKFFIAATTEDGSYLLTTDSLTGGSLTTTGNGIEVDDSYTWVFNAAYSRVVGLIYNQGDPGVGLSYGLNSNGELAKQGSDFLITSRFTTYGAFENYIVTSVGVATGAAAGDTVSSFTFIDINNNNNLTSKTISTKNFTGNGDYAVFSGIVDAGNGEFYTSAILSNSKNEPGTNGMGFVTFPDSVWVAKMDANLNVHQIYKDNRLSYSSGRFRSRLYPQITAGPDGDTYVFSGAFESTTTKPAGVIRIKSGASEFDPDFYINIQELSGGYKFRRVWYTSGSTFLVEFYNEKGDLTSNTAATNYALLNTSNSVLTWLNSSVGFPDIATISAVGDPLADDGKIYVPITVTNANPQVYVVDGNSGQTTKGVSIEAASVSALLKFNY